VWERRGAYKVLVVRVLDRDSLGRTRCRLENSIKMDLQELGRGQINPDLARDGDKWQIF
jgi:hypothetical protein